MIHPGSVKVDKEFYRTEKGLVVVLTIRFRNESIETYYLIRGNSFEGYEINQISAEIAFRLVRQK